DYLGYDDAADAWGVHGVGGFIGSICTALFASREIAALDGGVIPGGAFLDGNWTLLGYNLAGSVSILAYSFAGTMILLVAINAIPGCHFRPNEHDERQGGDLSEMGEMAYELVAEAMSSSVLSPAHAFPAMKRRNDSVDNCEVTYAVFAEDGQTEKEKEKAAILMV
ncbi:hypothetical protein HDU91_003228, partial [Kappamyces sp. JEL0680]